MKGEEISFIRVMTLVSNLLSEKEKERMKKLYKTALNIEYGLFAKKQDGEKK